jgi:hypothetical protein
VGEPFEVIIDFADNAMKATVTRICDSQRL